MRILIADDNPINQTFFATVLREAGHQVEVAGDGNEAVTKAIAAARPFHLVLMDLRMPGKDGIAATREIRTSTSTPPHIFAITAEINPEELAVGLFDRVLEKPIDAEPLLDAIASVEAFPNGEIDITAAQSASNGDLSLMRKLRAMLPAELARVRQQLPAQLDHDHAAASDLLHRLQASCGFTGARRLQSATQALMAALTGDKTLVGDPRSKRFWAELTALERALDMP